MRNYLTACALSLAACAAQHPIVSQESIDAAGTNWVACIDGQMQKMDDGHTDASTLALGIMPFCHSSFMSYVAVNGSNLNPAAKRMFYEKEQDQELALTTGTILRLRKPAS